MHLTALAKLVVTIGLVLVMCSKNAAFAGEVEDRIRALSQQYLPESAGSDDSAILRPNELLPKFYEGRDFKPAWYDTSGYDELIIELNAGVRQGFHPRDFHLPRLFDLYEAAKTGGADDVAMFDVVASDAAIRLIHHLVFGKVDPKALDPDWNHSRPIIQSDPAFVMNDYLAGQGFSALMARIAVDNVQYDQLLAALEQYRDIALNGGWPVVPDGEVIKPDTSDPRVVVLRERLLAEQGLTATNAQNSELYDEGLQSDVRRFQSRHGLEADGVIGQKTFRVLNRSVDERIDQLRLSLERARWLMRDLDGSFVLVNIAGARTYLVRSDDTIWTTRSITGSQYRKTPVFRDTIKYMEFNPTWTVPSSIFRKDKLSRIRKDPGYLERNGYRVRNRDGAFVSPLAVNWSAANPAVTLVQSPGPKNALGLVKFMFPNEYSVYLHDTSDRGLFDRNERNLSSGCVRLEHPFEFANLLMEGDPDWSQARMQSILDSKKTTRIDLPQPIPVLLTYWTAWVEDGEVHFREDIYERDAAILKALNE